MAPPTLKRKPAGPKKIRRELPPAVPSSPIDLFERFKFFDWSETN